MCLEGSGIPLPTAHTQPSSPSSPPSADTPSPRTLRTSLWPSATSRRWRLRTHRDGLLAPSLPAQDAGLGGNPVSTCRRVHLVPRDRTTEYRGGGIRTSLRRRSSKLRLSGVILLLAAADDGWDAWNRCSPPYFGKQGVCCMELLRPRLRCSSRADMGYEARSLTAMISSLRQNGGSICGHPPRVR